MHRLQLPIRNVRIRINHRALYTVFRLTSVNTWAQNGPN